MLRYRETYMPSLYITYDSGIRYKRRRDLSSVPLAEMKHDVSKLSTLDSHSGDAMEGSPLKLLSIACKAMCSIVSCQMNKSDSVAGMQVRTLFDMRDD